MHTTKTKQKRLCEHWSILVYRYELHCNLTAKPFYNIGAVAQTMDIYYFSVLHRCYALHWVYPAVYHDHQIQRGQLTWACTTNTYGDLHPPKSKPLENTSNLLAWHTFLLRAGDLA